MTTFYQRQKRKPQESWLDYKLSIDQCVFVALVAAGLGGLLIAWLS